MSITSGYYSRMPLADGDSFADFTILRLLGAGGMGEVYLAQHPRLPRRDALKLLPRDISANPHFRARFDREADLAAGLWHPNIVGVHDRGEVAGQLWISMDFVDGVDAAQLLAQQYPGGAPPALVIEIVTAVASALDHAHGRGLLHRDVKPANIMLAHRENGSAQRILLADFGIARSANEVGGLTETNMAIGTVAYSAPEQLTGGHLDGRTDQYALAASAYQLLTGELLFPHLNPAVVIGRHLNFAPPTLAASHPELARLDPVLATALAKNPEHRFARCEDFAAALAANWAEQRAAPPVAAAAPQPIYSALPTLTRPPPLTRPPTQVGYPARPGAPTWLPPAGPPAAPARGPTGAAAGGRRRWLVPAAVVAVVAIVAVVALAWRPWADRGQQHPAASSPRSESSSDSGAQVFAPDGKLASQPRPSWSLTPADVKLGAAGWHFGGPTFVSDLYKILSDFTGLISAGDVLIGMVGFDPTNDEKGFATPALFGVDAATGHVSWVTDMNFKDTGGTCVSAVVEDSLICHSTEGLTAVSVRTGEPRPLTGYGATPTVQVMDGSVFSVDGTTVRRGTLADSAAGWQHTVELGNPSEGSGLVAENGLLAVTNNDDVTVLDAATGNELFSAKGVVSTSIRGDAIVVFYGKSEGTTTTVDHVEIRSRTGEVIATINENIFAYGGWIERNSSADVVVVGDAGYNATSGAVLWRDARLTPVGTIGIIGDVVVAVTNEDELFAVDAKSGKSRWSTPTGFASSSAIVTDGATIVTAVLGSLKSLAIKDGDASWTVSYPSDSGESPNLAAHDTGLTVKDSERIAAYTYG
jgi:hypothetical protein